MLLSKIRKERLDSAGHIMPKGSTQYQFIGRGFKSFIVCKKCACKTLTITPKELDRQVKEYKKFKAWLNS